MPDPLPVPTVARRTLLTASAAAAVLSSAPAAFATAPDAPPLPLYEADFTNWSGEIRVPGALTCAPTSQPQVAAAATWAYEHGYTARARGTGHGWSPLLAENGPPSRPTLLIDTRGLSALSEVPGVRAVRAEAGATLEAVMDFLAQRDWSLSNVPDIGVATVGGMLAIGAHGCAVPADGEDSDDAQPFGSFSNRVLTITAVVWDERARRFDLKTFDRRDPEAAALLVSLGRALVTEVVLAVEPERALRCLSRVDVPIAELLGPPGAGGRSVDHFLRTSGRIDILWYAFTERPWLKTWHLAPTKPLLSRKVTGPYNYPFTDNIPEQVTELARQLVTGNPSAAPTFGKVSLEVTGAGLIATAATDLWGRSKDVLLWLRPSTLRVHQQSYAILTRRRDAQRVLHEFRLAFVALRDRFAAAEEFPVNMPLEIRVSGLDDPTGLAAGARRPSLSPLAVAPEDPWQVAIWISVATLPGTPGHHRFNRALEQWVLRTYAGQYALARPEWSKGWGYTDDAGWADPVTLAALTGRFRGFDQAAATLDDLDPHRVFSSPALARLGLAG